MHMYMHIIHTYMYMCISTCKYICMHAYICTYRYTHTYAYTQVYAYVHIHVFSYAHMRTYAYLHAYLCMHVHVHMHIHIHIYYMYVIGELLKETLQTTGDSVLSLNVSVFPFLVFCSL